MPSGRTHLLTELALLPPLAAGYVLLLRPSLAEGAAFVGAYLFSSLLLSPDLDLRRNDARRRWGPLGFLWGPYAKLFKHRGLSHSLLWGPLTRLLYLTVVLGGVALALVASGLMPPPTLTPAFPLSLNGRLVLAVLVGLYLPNGLHVLLDRVMSAARRRRRRRA